MPQGCRVTLRSAFKTLVCVCLFTTFALFWLGHSLKDETEPRSGYVKMNQKLAHRSNVSMINTGISPVTPDGLAANQTKAKDVKSETFYDRFRKDYSGNFSEWQGFPPNRYILNSPRICLQEKPELIAVVISAITHFERRQLIRDNWGSKESKIKNKMAVVYIFGSTLDGGQQDFLLLEKKHYNDIIQVDFLDTYRNLTFKSVAMLKWLKDVCPSARFVLKADDDMLINPEVLLPRLQNYQTRFDKFFFCAVRKKIKVVRSKDYKWYISEKEYKETLYPTHCSGTAYSFSMSAVEVLLRNTLTTPPIWLEDIYISGMLAPSIVHVHAKEFKFYLMNYRNRCLYKKEIAMHLIPLPKRKVIYAAMRNC